MTFKELIELWNASHRVQRTDETFTVHLPVDSAARLLALAELYPDRGVEELITDLLSVALDEIETAMPYVPGDRVIREDEFGDPVFEDAGLTPRFEALRRKHLQQLGARKQ